MILKMYDERTDTFYFVENVKEVTKRHDITCDVDDDDICTERGVLTVYKNKKTNEIMQYYDYHKKYSDKGERVLDDSWVIAKNRNVIFHCDQYFVYYREKYKSDDVYSFKVIEAVLNNDELKRYMLPSHQDVYILNTDGKTVDRI